MKFVLCNQSTDTAPAHGGPLLDSILDQICNAAEVQLNVDVSLEWGGNHLVRRGAPDGSDRVPGEVPGYIVDSLPDAPGAAAFHDRTPDGQPIMYFARDAFTSLTSGAEALSVGITHELIETAIDPGANRWADRADGKEQALEGCDKVQDGYYDVEGVSCSNFLLQAAFSPGAPRPWDKMGALTEQDGRTAGGYDIVRTAAQDVSQEQGKRAEVHGTILARHRAHKAHWSSRTYRRGVRLA